MLDVFSPFPERRMDTIPNTDQGLVDSAAPYVSITDDEGNL